MSSGPDFSVETLELDLPAVAGAFGRRLHEAGVPVSAERSARFAQALALVRPVSRRQLYFTARSVYVSDHSQLRPFDRVFAEVFGGGSRDHGADEAWSTEPAPDDERRAHRPGRAEGGEGLSSSSGSSGDAAPERESERELPVAMLASDEERLRSKRFDALEPAELAALYALMSRLRIATPLRRTRRARRDDHGERFDLRRTLRRSMRTGGDPIRLARRRRRVVQRRIVMLCDISGSMEPYARAYLQFLTCAAAGGSHAEAFVFATRLTRLTRALASRSPERAIQRAAAAAPDWSSGTRIGDALKTFNDRHGRRGIARGAVVVVLSDGWERGDPALLAREMKRLSRLAHRIVWVNPRVSGAEFAPSTGGMAAALPFLDALVSGHSLDALGEVVAAIGAGDARGGGEWRRGEWRRNVGSAGEEGEAGDEPWGSATPVAGSSVAMPSGYGPSRGNTTPGWDR